MSELILGKVNQDSPRSESEGTEIGLKCNKRGELCVIDFYTEMAMEGRAFNVRAGTVTTHFTGDIDVTDTAAEMTADPPSGTTIIPCYANIHIEALGGTVPILTGKSVATCSTAGDAFVPLPLYRDGNASSSSARADAAGGATVTAELTTTTCRHFSYTMAAVDCMQIWEPRTPPFVVGAGCFYLQIAATTTGPNYYACFDFIELPTINVS